MESEAEQELERKLKQLDNELPWIFSDENTLNSVRTAMNEVKKFDLSTIDFEDVCQKIAVGINIAALLFPSIKVFKIAFPLANLAKVFVELGKALESNNKAIEENKGHQRVQRTDIRTEANAFEKGLVTINAHLSVLRKAPEGVTEKLDFDISDSECVNFLQKLQGKTKSLIFASDMESARKAAEYVNLYFRIAILRTVLLWQVYCIKRRTEVNRSGVQNIWEALVQSQKTDLEMLRLVTVAHFEKTMFLTVFHPNKNKNFLLFLRIQEYEIPCIAQDCRFTSQVHVIRSSNAPDVRLEMPSFHGSKCIVGTKEPTEACLCKFNPVQYRKLDNVFFITSSQGSKRYVCMSENGTCFSQKEEPGEEGQWKLVRLKDTSGGSPQFILSRLKLPCMFLCMDSIHNFSVITGTHDLEKVKACGVWDILYL